MEEAYAEKAVHRAYYQVQPELQNVLPAYMV